MNPSRWLRYSIIPFLTLTFFFTTACKNNHEEVEKVKEAQRQESQSLPKKKEYKVTDVQAIPALPTSLETFKKLRDQMAKKSPEAGFAVFLAAMIAYVQKVPDAKQMLLLSFDAHLLKNGGTDFGPTLDARLKTFRPYIAYSYVAGTSAEENYAFSWPIRIEINSDTPGQGHAKQSTTIRVFSTGAETPRPIKMKRDPQGYWRVYNEGSFITGVRPPR